MIPGAWAIIIAHAPGIMGINFSTYQVLPAVLQRCFR
jgi:hypothetical protein